MTKFVLLIIGLSYMITTVRGLSGQTTRYWDCCKVSCSWSGKAAFNRPVETCAKDGDSVWDNADTTSGCDGGGAYVCNDNQPWAINDQLAYGFAATNIGGGGESDWCCACYLLTFTSGAVSRKQMVVQATNTGGDLGYNHFDLQMPGGGVGWFEQGCPNQWDLTSNWGARYGGVSSESECNSLPSPLQRGCRWRFQWFQNADNPGIEFERVRCPQQLTDITACVRDDDNDPSLPDAPGASTDTTGATSAPAPTTTPPPIVSTTAPGPVTTAPAPPTGQPNQCSNDRRWQKCAGIGYNGETCCPTGFSCQYINDWHWQCNKASQATTPAPEVTTTTTNQPTTSTQAPTSNPETTVPTTTPSPPVQEDCSWSQEEQQCGGIGWNGDTCCPSGFKCEYVNQYYSQCKVDPSADSCGFARRYQQCAGESYNGETCCPIGFNCQYQNQYYSQCLRA